MIYSTATLPVNVPGQTPLTRAQVWEGLVQKARDAKLFFPPDECTRCEIVEESTSHLVREATILGDDLTEIIVFDAGTKITFFQAQSPREGAIINELVEDENGELQLRFYCYLGLRGKVPIWPGGTGRPGVDGQRQRIRGRDSIDFETHARAVGSGKNLSMLSAKAGNSLPCLGDSRCIANE